MKYIKTTYLLAITVLTVMNSCTSEQMEKLLEPLVVAPGATIERQVKGHDQIYSIQAILRLTLKRTDNYSYAAYGLSNFKEPPVPIYQQIDISKDDMGRIRITSARKAFDVVKSTKYFYSLELRYFDLNGKFINHQFSTYDEKDPEGSTLLHHQHFFTLQNYSLYGQQLVYPMTLDSLYYDEFTFQRDENQNRIESSEISPNNVYVPINNTTANSIKYNQTLAQRAIEKSSTKAAKEIYTDAATGQQYKLCKALIPTRLDDQVQKIFRYWYRDTDPVEEELYKKIRGIDDLGRDRFGKPTQLLQQKRDLTTKSKQDYLGFKGVLQFYRDNIAFQMRVCIAHMVTSTEKYIGVTNLRGSMHEHNQISPAWNSYDIDYPLAFRVIADADGDKTKFVKDIQKYYPQADADKLIEMFSGDPEWFHHIPQITM